MSVFDRIRQACAEVAGRARRVGIDRARAARFASELVEGAPPPPVYDPAHHYQGDAHATLTFVLALDAINFGSGWFPSLRKLPGCSGYLTIATQLTRHFEAHGPPTAATLRAMDAARVTRILGQEGAPVEVPELMALFASALCDLGAFVEREHGGRFEGPIEAAGGRAEGLVEELLRMPLYRDVAHYRGLEVPFYKRAQITAADLALAFQGQGPGRFEDIDALTLFADNLVPHVLRMEGVLDYDEALAAAIEAGRLLSAGSEEEVEIRACALHAGEVMAQALADRGRAVPVRELDWRLWSRGQRPQMKSRPRHRTRTSFY